MEIYELLQKLAAEGVGILLISSEFSELLSLTHTVFSSFATPRSRASLSLETPAEELLYWRAGGAEALTQERRSGKVTECYLSAIRADAARRRSEQVRCRKSEGQHRGRANGLRGRRDHAQPQQIRHFAGLAANLGADIAIFPECCTTGYFIGDKLSTLGRARGRRHGEGARRHRPAAASCISPSACSPRTATRSATLSFSLPPTESAWRPTTRPTCSRANARVLPAGRSARGLPTPSSARSA